MSLRKKIGLVVCLWLCSGALHGQNTLIFTEPEEYFRRGVELVDKKKFAAAQDMFAKYLEYHTSTEEAVESEYYISYCAMYLQNGDFEKKAADFVGKYPSHPKSISANYNIGNYFFERGEYLKAITHLGKIYFEDDIKSEEELEASYKLAYSNFATKKYYDAHSVFNHIKEGEHKYAYASSYYAGYISLMDGELENAQADLVKAAKDSEYAPHANVLLPSIYYKKKEFQKVIDYAEKLKQGGAEIPLQLHLLLADSYFEKGNFNSAAASFKIFMGRDQEKPDRNVMYKYAYTCAKTNKQDIAVQYFGKVADGADTLAQLAAYHLGVSSVEIGQKEYAAAAFDKCRKLAFNKTIQEEGAYYYAKVSFDISLFEQALAGCGYYIDKFPDGPHKEEVYALSSDVYLKTGDYETALSHIEKIENKTPKIKAAYQRIAFNKAAADYNNEKYREALAALFKSLQYPSDKELLAETQYWLGEVYMAGNKYDSALYYYNKLPQDNPLYQQTGYARGYAAFNQQKYEAALVYFKQYIDEMPAADPKFKKDAHLRLADCYYVTKKPNAALTLYEMALKEGGELDYLYYQLGNTYSSKQEHAEAIKYFSLLGKEYPNSPYIDLAYYNKAMIFLEKGERAEAVNSFGYLIDNYPKSTVLPYALSQRAIVNRILGKFSEAEKDQKRIIKEFPLHKLAESAIQTLQEMSGQGLLIADLDDYIIKFKEANPNSLATLKGDFETAKIPYDNGDYEKAVASLQNFLSRAPSGTAVVYEANYYLGFSYEQLKSPEKSVDYYAKVEADFKARAQRKLADIQLEAGRWQKAIDAYSQVSALSKDKKSQCTATEGLMKCYYGLKDYEATMQYADDQIANGLARYVPEAELYKALALKDGPDENGKEKAAVLFKKVADENQNAVGAKARFNLGISLREQKEFQKSIDELIVLRKMGGADAQTQRIVAEAYLIIADNYINLDNKFQAKATLQSLVDNSNVKDIVDKARKRLDNMNF